MPQDPRQGFTLIELMIVVAIIAIILAIAIPSLQASKKSAVEAKAIGLMRTFISVEEQYRTRFGTYAVDPNDLWNNGYMIDLANSQYLEEYDGDYNATKYDWNLQMTPDDPGVTADRSFFADQTGVIRVNLSGPATSTSPPLE